MRVFVDFARADFSFFFFFFCFFFFLLSGVGCCNKTITVTRVVKNVCHHFFYNIKVSRQNLWSNVSGQSLTNFGQSTVYTIKVFQSVKCTFKIMTETSHNTLFSGKWIMFIRIGLVCATFILRYMNIRKRLVRRQRRLRTRDWLHRRQQSST